MGFINILLFCIFMFATGVIVRFYILRKVFEPPGPFDERQELVYTIIAAALIILAVVIMASLRTLGMLVAIIPGLAGLLWGESVYYGWDRLQRIREDERYSELE